MTAELPSGAPPARKPRRGDELALRIAGFDERGRSYAHCGDIVVHVRGARPGELVTARILRRRGDRAEAQRIARIESSPLVVAARCAHFGTCGGCSLQDLDYAAQLEGLHATVVRAFAARGLLARIAVEPVVPAVELFEYRNKMDFTFSNRRWVDLSEPQGAEVGFALGLHAARFFRKVIDVRSCAIQTAACDGVLRDARDLVRAAGLAPWDVMEHTGCVRHLVLRTARTSGEIMVHLVTAQPSSDELAAIDGVARELVVRHPKITTFVHSVSTRQAAVAIGESERIVHGPGVLLERVCGLTFAVSAASFFQTNTAQAEVLFGMVREEARLCGTELVYDLYCGTGSIALTLAAAARAIVGLEQVPQAVTDARANAERNGIANVEFRAGDVLEELRRDLEAPVPARADVVVVDPPRAGLHPRVVPLVASLAPQRIVYVSCNPASAAADLAALVEHGYEIARIRPIDLFPHTPHVECVIRLERRATAAPVGSAT